MLPELKEIPPLLFTKRRVYGVLKKLYRLPPEISNWTKLSSATGTCASRVAPYGKKLVVGT